MTERAALPLVTAGIILIAVTALSLSLGKYHVSFSSLFTTLWAKVPGSHGASDPVLDTVIWQVRMPRVLAGLIVGAALAGAGSVYQALFRNPLVSPDILGVSAGASVGAVSGIFLSLPLLAIQALSFVGGLAAVGFVYVIARMLDRRDPILVLVLAGIAVGASLGRCFRS